MRSSDAHNVHARITHDASFCLRADWTFAWIVLISRFSVFYLLRLRSDGKIRRSFVQRASL